MQSLKTAAAVKQTQQKNHLNLNFVNVFEIIK